MKKYIALILLVGILSLGLVYRQAIAATSYNLLYQSPCDTPKLYKIGSIDSRFTLSQSELAKAVHEAENVWERAYTKNLFANDPKANMTVNLVYDERQSLNQELNQQNNDLKEKDTTLRPELAEHKRKSEDLHRRVAALNAEIESWNQKGGAPEDVYTRLRDQQESLRKEIAALNAEAASLSEETEQFNAEVQEFNDTVHTFNEELEEKPEGGLYTKKSTGETIDIYIYSTREELINILAHELGHSLGIGHVPNERSIMYAKTNEAVTPTAEDISALDVACEKQNVIVMKAMELSYMLNQFIATNFGKE